MPYHSDMSYSLTCPSDSCQVFGLTHRELRYIKVYSLFLYQFALKNKFLNMRRPSDLNSSPPPFPSHPPRGVSMPISPVVVLIALGYIGFKVISTCGNSELRKFSLEVLKTQFESSCLIIIIIWHKQLNMTFMSVCRSDGKLVCQYIFWFIGPSVSPRSVFWLESQMVHA